MPNVYIQYLMLNMKTYKDTHQPYLILGNISITLIRNTTARWSIFGSRERERDGEYIVHKLKDVIDQ